MRVFRDLGELKDVKDAVITIGSFDGVHIGHQKIINRLKQLSTELNSENYLITFDPHPRSVIYPKDKTLRLLSSQQEKIDLFESFGIDNLVIVPFTIEFSQINPIEYIEKFLVKNFKPKYIVIGYDHRFGLNRGGDLSLLNSVKDRFNFKVVEIPKQEIDQITISSTKVRNSIINGDLESANTLLNHKYSLSGKVVRGRKLGTEIGFPTANLQLEESKKLVPKDGIYACNVIVESNLYKGMLYIGDIPTIGTDNPKTIEVNIFDFNADIYDKRICIEVLKYLRDDEKFDGLEDLKKQLHIDRSVALSFFDTQNSTKTEKVTVAILNYNTKHFLETFLPSISYSSDSDFDTLVIDNASSDESIEFVNDWFPEVKTVQFENNHGFAEGYNLGLKDISTEYIALVNSDVEVSQNWLDPIIDFLDNNKDYAAAMPKILSQEEKDSFEYAGGSGGFIDTLAYPFCRGRIFDTLEIDKKQYNDNADIFWASGAAFVVRKDVFNTIGGFDPDYFAHQEEIDFCWRVHKAGYKISAIPSSVVYHVGGGTLNYGNSQKVYLNFRNSLFNIFKNETLFNLIWKVPMRLLLDGVAGVKFLLQGQAKSTIAILRAHFSFYSKIFTLIKKRRDIKNIIKKNAFGKPNKSGMTSKFIIFQYYLFGNKKYSDIFKS